MGEKKKFEFVGAKLSSVDKALLEAAAKIKGVSLSRFLLDSALQEARSLVGESPTPGPRRGPRGHAEHGEDLALTIKASLTSKYGAEEGKIWLDLIGEAAQKNDHIIVWNYLFRCLPEAVRGIPDRGQVAFAKAFIKVFLSATK